MDLQRWVKAWIASTKRVIRFFNPSLPEATVERIARAILTSSYRHKVDPRFVVAVIAAESRFDPYAVSPKGALGLGQIMPENLASLGITDPFNIEQNVEGCVKLLRRYLDQYAGHPDQFRLVLACYNAGPEAVRKYGGVPPYEETREYIRRVAYYYRCLCGQR